MSPSRLLAPTRLPTRFRQDDKKAGWIVKIGCALFIFGTGTANGTFPRKRREDRSKVEDAMEDVVNATDIVSAASALGFAGSVVAGLAMWVLIIAALI